MGSIEMRGYCGFSKRLTAIDSLDVNGIGGGVQNATDCDGFAVILRRSFLVIQQETFFGRRIEKDVLPLLILPENTSTLFAGSSATVSAAG
jgi:hypothetical protein